MANLSHRLSGFFRTVAKSCYDMEFYRGVRTSQVSAAFRYAVALHLLLMLVTMTFLTPMAFVAKSRVADYIRTELPENAEIAVTKGVMSTTLSVPYELGNDEMHVVIDSSYEGSSFPDGALKTEGVLIGREHFFVRNSPNETHTYPLKDIPDGSLTRTQALDWLSGPATWVLALSLVAFAAMYWLLFLGSTLFSVAVYSAISYGFGNLMKVRLRYGQWYAVGLHAVTLPMLAGLLLTALNVHIPYAYTVLFFLIIAAVIQDERNQPVSGAPGVTMAPPMPPSEPHPPADPKPPITPPAA